MRDLLCPRATFRCLGYQVIGKSEFRILIVVRNLKNMNHLITKISTPAKGAIILGHALVGWIYCGAIIGIGRQFMSMQATLVMHAIGAPLGFILLSLFYFKRFAFTSPLQTALLFLVVVIGMDVFVVAMLIEKSFTMFSSPLGTWLPFALIFSSTYITGAICKHGEKPLYGAPNQSIHRTVFSRAGDLFVTKMKGSKLKE